MVEEFDDGISAQLLQYRTIGGVCGIENFSGARSYGPLLPRCSATSTNARPDRSASSQPSKSVVAQRTTPVDEGRATASSDALILSAGPLGSRLRRGSVSKIALQNGSSTATEPAAAAFALATTQVKYSTTPSRLVSKSNADFEPRLGRARAKKCPNSGREIVKTSNAALALGSGALLTVW